VGIARSRSVAAPVIEKFKLREVYDVPYAEDAYQVLNRRLDATFDSKETLLTLAVRDRDPQRAASLANALVEELERRSIELNLGSASQERAFLEKRLADVKQGLAAAEDALKKFQQEHRAFGLDEQAKAIIEALGRLQGELAGKEIELGVLRTFQTERNPQVQVLTAKIEEIRRQLMALEKSPTGSRVAGGGMVTTVEMPELAIRFGRLLRDYKVQEVLYELLAKQYELARVEEAKTTTRLQILDWAVPPERKSGPKRLFIMVLATSVSLFLTIVAIFACEAWRKATASEPELAERIRQELRRKRAWK